VDGAGFLLNDEMDDFALRPGTPNAFGVLGYDANAVAPGRRPLSSMAPSFMIGKDKVAVLGAKGGSRIITQVLLGMLGIEQGKTPAQVVALRRFHHQYLPDTIVMEPDALSADALKTLAAMGHDSIEHSPEPWVYYMQVAQWDRRSGALSGAADPRNIVGSARVVVRADLARTKPAKGAH
jgi:gamma-glutamyltranspeptidase/glutathione hydrolase